MKSRLLGAVAALAIVAGVSLSANAKTLVYCSEGSPEGFNPQLYTAGTTFDASSKTLFNRLVEFERGTTNVMPGLAESWDVSDDGLVYTFHLRQGVKFAPNSSFTPTRDFNHVSDTVAAFLVTGNANGLSFGRAYNAGTGVAVSIAAMIDLVRAATGTNKPIAQSQERFRPEKSEVRALLADSRARQAATDWKPKVDLKTGIGGTVTWWRKRLAAGHVRAGAQYMV